MSFKNLVEKRRKQFDSEVEQLYEYYTTEATEEEKLYRSVFRLKVQKLMHCSRQKSFNLITALECTYNLSFVRNHFTTTHKMPEHVKLALQAGHKPWSVERRAKFGEAVTARQLGKTYEITANGKRLGKKNLIEQSIIIPSFETAATDFSKIIV